MGRADDERPAIEIVGADPPITSVQHVSTRGPGGPRRRGIRVLLVAGAVVGLLVAGLALGGDDEDTPASDEQAEADAKTTTTRPRSTTTRPTSTTASTTTTTTGPLFAGQPLDGWLLSGNVSGWTLVDIATGARLETELPFDDPYSTRSVTGGVVTVVAGQVEYHDLRVAEDVREPVVLGPADQVLMAVVPDQVWLLQGAYEEAHLRAAGPGSSTSRGGSFARFASRAAPTSPRPRTACCSIGAGASTSPMRRGSRTSRSVTSSVSPDPRP